MEIQRKIVIMVLITLTMGQAKEDLDIMKEMMVGMKMEMNERLSLAEGKLAKTEARLAAIKDDLEVTQDELAVTKDDFAVTKDELAATKEDLAVAKDDLSATKDELAVTKDALAKVVLDQAEAHAITKEDLAITKQALTITNVALMSKTDELEREVAILKAPPYIHACGSHYDILSASSGTIPYTSLLYSSTNQEDGGLDISTGVFTAPHGGSYTVYWDTSAYLDSGEIVYIYLEKNEMTIQESEHHSRYTGPSGVVYDQGGRTMVVYLGLYDTLQLSMNAASGDIRHITFCVSLTTPDIV